MRGFLAAGLAAALCLLAAQSAKADVSGPRGRATSDFAALPFIQRPSLSPDGTKVAALVDARGKQYFAIMPLIGEGNAPRLLGIGDNDINWWRWVNDEWLVLGIGSVTQVEGNEWYVRRAVAVNVDAKTIKPLLFKQAAQNADDLLWTATDGSPRILLALQKSIYSNNEGFWPEVVEVNVATGKFKRVVAPRPGVVDWYADGAGVVRLGVGASEDGRQIRLLYRPNEKAMFKTLDRANLRKGEKLVVPALFLQDPNTAIAFSDKDGFSSLYRLDLNSLEYGEKIFGREGYDIDRITIGDNGSKLLGVKVTEEAERTYWLDPDMAEVQGALDQSVPGRKATIVSMDRPRQRLLVHVGAPDRPGAYFFFDRDVGVMHRFAGVMSTLDKAKLNPVSTIRYRARDGLEIMAVLTLPTGRPSKDLPLVVMPHGGPFARDSETFDWWSQFLAERGYAVVQPNYRGSSGLGSSFAEKGEGQWGLAMQDDLNDAVAHLAKAGIADPRRVCMVGASYGGYAAMRAAQRDGALYKCAVSYAGVSDLGAMIRHDSRFLHSGARKDWIKEQAPDVRAVSPIHFADQFSIPILISHGKEDRRVPVRQSREMVEKLRKAGKPVSYVEQPEGDHHFSRAADRLEFLTALENFLAEHNPAH